MKKSYKISNGWIFEDHNRSIYSLTRNISYSLANFDINFLKEAFNYINSVETFTIEQFIEHLHKIDDIFPQHATNLFNKLFSFSVIQNIDHSATVNEEYFSRQTAFWKLFEDNSISAYELNENIRNSSIFVIGLGGFGTWITLLSALIGIKRISAIDFDKVELSNLSRQIIYTEQDVGLKKTEVAKKIFDTKFKQVNFNAIDLRINYYEDLLPLINEVDLVFLPFGFPEKSSLENSLTKQVLIACEKKNVPCVILGNSIIGPLLTDQHTKRFEKIYQPENIWLSKSNILNNKMEKFQAAFTPRLALNSSLAIWECSKYLSRSHQCYIVNTALYSDTINYSPNIFISFE
jgi:hypothetical protein